MTGSAVAGTAAISVHIRQPPRNRLVGLSLAVVAAGLAALADLGAAHHWGATPLAIGLFLVQAVLALAWSAALDVRGSGGVVVLGVASAGVTDGLLASDVHQGLGIMAAVGGVGLVLGLLHQLRRRPRPGVAASLAGTGSLILLELCAASPLALRTVIPRSSDAIVAGLFGVAAVALVGRAADFVVRRPALAPGSSRGLIGTWVGIAAAAAAGGLWGQNHLPFGGVGVGVRIAVITAVLAVVADLAIDIAGADDGLDDRPRAALTPLVILLPIAMAGPALYVASRYLLS